MSFDYRVNNTYDPNHDHHRLSADMRSRFATMPDRYSNRSAVSDDISSRSSSSSEDEDPPLLKYNRIENDVSKIIPKSKITAVTLNDRFILVGTQNGHVHQFDHNGFEIEGKFQRPFPVHPVAVTCLSLDQSGSYYASCSNDGRINIFGLFDHNFDFQECLPFKIEAVCLDPRFPLTRAFVTGGDRPLFWEKGLFGKYKKAELTRLPGSVMGLVWHKHYIAYAVTSRVQIYDVNQHANIEAIEKEDAHLRNELYPCRLAWQPENMLIVGWGKTFSVYRMYESFSSDSNRFVGDPKRRLLELHHSFKLDDFICGVWPYYDKIHKYFVVLCYPDVSEFRNQSLDELDHSADGSASSSAEEEDERLPMLHIIEPTQIDEYDIVREEVMKLNKFEDCFAVDYRLTGIIEENTYIVHNGHDLILGIPTVLDDDIEWLFERNRLDDALKLAQNNRAKLKESYFNKIGIRYLNKQVENGNFQKAAENCNEILGRSTPDWENLIHEFMQKHQLKVLSTYIPTSEPQLKSEFYELTLLIFLKIDPEHFLQLVNKWPGHIYNPQIIINEVIDTMEKLKKHEEDIGSVREQNQQQQQLSPLMIKKYKNWYLESLALLYLHIGQYSEAVKIYIRRDASATSLPPHFSTLSPSSPQSNQLQSIGSQSSSSQSAAGATFSNYVFGIIHKHNLYHKMVGEVEALINFDKERSLQMLTTHTSEMPVKTCIAQLRNKDSVHSRKLLFEYLDVLYTTDSQLCAGYEDLLVELYAEFPPYKLLTFLKDDPEIDFPKALEVCRKYERTHEMIHIMKRTGDHSRALQLINAKLNVHEAIKYCKDVDEQFLWDQLIESSKDNPKYITGLLNNIGTHTDPIKVIEKIKYGLEIPGLRDSLVKILQDYNLQRNLTEGCSNILVKDCFDLMNRMVHSQKRGQLISSPRQCLICHRAVTFSGNEQQVVASSSNISSSNKPNSHLDHRRVSAAAAAVRGGATGSGSSQLATDGITIFNCSHLFHSDCLATQQHNTTRSGTNHPLATTAAAISGGGARGSARGSVKLNSSGAAAVLLSKMNSLVSINDINSYENVFFCPQCDMSR